MSDFFEITKENFVWRNFRGLKLLTDIYYIKSRLRDRQKRKKGK
jgi:hypothetical protein